MSFKVIKPGFLSTIQDYGRLGYGQFGLSQSGPVDEHAYCWANYLLANQFDDAVLEITMGNCVLEATAASQIVVTGADCGFKVNGERQPLWTTRVIKAGDVLSWDIAKPEKGIRCYLAVKGGFQTEQKFGSKSVNLREGLGAKLEQGDIIAYSPFKTADTPPQQIPWHYKPRYDEPLVLRLLPTYQFDSFSEQQKAMLLNQAYTISPESDRTGCRLLGNKMADVPKAMVSEGISYGSVEVTTTGLPIILLRESPTIGGYPKIGTVFSLDLAKLAQRAAGSELRFAYMTLVEAQQQRRRFNAFFSLV